jgi:hypothetical protein
MTLQQVLKLRKHRPATPQLSHAEGLEAGLKYEIGCGVVRGGFKCRDLHPVVVLDKKQTRSLWKVCDPRLYNHSSHRATAFWCCQLWWCLLLSASVVSIRQGVSTFPLSREDSLEIIFVIHEEHRRNLAALKKAPILDTDKDDLDPNYGGIERSNDASNTYEKYRSRFLDAIDNEEIPESYENDEDREDKERACRGPKWNSYIFPTCNSVHEHTIERVMGLGKEQDYDVTYLRYASTWILVAGCVLIHLP